MKMSRTLSWVIACVLLTVSLSAAADHDDRRDWRWRDGRGDWRGDWRGDDRDVWRGDIWRFREHDMDRWRGGYWVHGDHDGRWGWWWVVTGLWYFYPRPIYPYPDPYIPYEPAQPVLPVPSTPPTVQYWYYCEGAKAYYPYVESCPGGWKRVPATPSAPGR